MPRQTVMSASVAVVQLGVEARVLRQRQALLADNLEDCRPTRGVFSAQLAGSVRLVGRAGRSRPTRSTPGPPPARPSGALSFSRRGGRPRVEPALEKLRTRNGRGPSPGVRPRASASWPSSARRARRAALRSSLTLRGRTAVPTRPPSPTRNRTRSRTAVVGPRRDHRRRGGLPDRDAARLRRPVGDRGERGGVLVVEDRLRCRQDVDAARGRPPPRPPRPASTKVRCPSRESSR